MTGSRTGEPIICVAAAAKGASTSANQGLLVATVGAENNVRSYEELGACD